MHKISPQAWPAMHRSLVAILRGIKSAETEPIVKGLIDSGFEAIEIPLNSPDPFKSIEIAAKIAPSNVLIGAGTVLTGEDVASLHDAGGKLAVSPNVEPIVLEEAGRRGMITMPGVFTATEALTAIRYGASGLKFFPASVLGPKGIQAIQAVLPPDTVVGAVGGVSEVNFDAYRNVGIKTFGLGSSLYKPGASEHEVRQKAEATIVAYDAVFSG